MDLLHDLCQRCVTDFLSLLGSVSVVLAKCRLFSTVACLCIGVRWFISRPGHETPSLTFLLYLFFSPRKYRNVSFHTVKIRYSLTP